MTIETLARTGFVDYHAGLAGIDTRRLRAMRNEALRATFRRMEDTAGRMEYIISIRGRQYYNDAASRNVSATWFAIEELQGGIVWITCGIPEQVDYSRLLPVVQRKVRVIYVLGPADGVRSAFSTVVPNIVECHSMADALKRAYYYDAPDVKVLFSPATSDPQQPTSSLYESFINEVHEL